MIAPILKLIINEDSGMTEYHQAMNYKENEHVIVQKIRDGKIVYELSYTKESWEVVLNKVFPIFKYDFKENFDHNDYYLEICRYRETLSSSFKEAIKNHFINLLKSY